MPLVLVGVAAKSLIEGPLASLWVVAGSLLAGSAYMALAEYRAARQGRGRPEERTTFADAMIIGSSQILALLLPGFSRSGASISTGLLRGIDRVAATRLSFFLSIPALVGAGAYELKDALGGATSAGALLVGTVTSFVVAYAVVAWFLRFVARHDFQVFVWYRIALAVFVVTCLATGALSS